jgi:uncharacterized membrane protein (UPF0127 family)
MRFFILVAALAVLCVSCGSRTTDENPITTRTVTLPDGTKIRAEVMLSAVDMARGYMFRDSVPSGTGMLFIHPKPGPHTYFMYNVRVPLDIVFMDANRTVLEIAASVPPCKTKASECPTYGGNARTQFVLELGGGEAARHGVRAGVTLSF